MLSEDEPVSGVMTLVPADDGGFVPADWLVDALAWALADDDALFAGLLDALAEGEDTAACVGAELVQVAFGVGWIVFWPVPPDAGLVRGLGVGLGRGLGDTGGVVLGVPLGLLPVLTLAPGLLVLALAETLALELAAPALLWLPLDDVAGAVAFFVGLLVEPAVVSVADACVDRDGQELMV